MALTYTEQYAVATNKKDFEKFIIIGAVRVAKDWLGQGNNYMPAEKVFPTTSTDPSTGEVSQINQKAEVYRLKVHNLCVRVLNKDTKLFDSIQTLIACELSDMGIALGDLGSPDAFISSQEGALNSSILSIFEKLAGVSPSEKQDYDKI